MKNLSRRAFLKMPAYAAAAAGVTHFLACSSKKDEGIILLQYNTHLFKGSKAPEGRAFKEGWHEFKRFWTRERFEPLDPVLFADDKRRDAIKEKIKQINADIVALNEVWSDDNMDWFARELKGIYPWSALGPKSDVLIAGSGLVLLSKFEIEKSSYYIYNRHRGSGTGTKIPLDFEEDTWANKGVLVAAIRKPSGKKFVISISHTAGIDDIDQLVKQTEKITADLAANDCPIIVAGDLNVHKSQRDQLNDKFRQMNAKDAWVELKGAQSGETVNFPQNKLDEIFRPHRVADSKNEGQVDRLDYVFYTPPLKPVAARVIRDWTFPTEGYYRDILRARWQSNYVAIRSFELNGHPYLFGLKKDDNAYISRIRDDGRGWDDLGKWPWQSNYLGSAVRTFQLKGHPYIFGLKKRRYGLGENGHGYISRIKDDGRGWDDLGKWPWQQNYVAVVPFYLNGHPYLFGLKDDNNAYISRIKDDGRGWDDLGKWPWQSNYVANAITTFELKGHPYVFGLKKDGYGYISRIKDDGKGWDDLGKWPWRSNYVAVVSYQLDGHPYLFGLKETDEAFISRINDDGKGWRDVSTTEWSSNYRGTCITPFYFKGDPFLFTLKENDEGWITKLTKPGEELIDLSDHYPLEVAFLY